MSPLRATPKAWAQILCGKLLHFCGVQVVLVSFLFYSVITESSMLITESSMLITKAKSEAKQDAWAFFCENTG